MSICPQGRWVVESQAMEILGFSSSAELTDAVTTGRFPHVLAGEGSSVKSANPPFTQHTFYYITSEGESAESNLSLKLLQWISVCQALGDSKEDFSEMEPRQIGLMAKYAGKPSVEPDSFDSLLADLKDAHAVILPDELSQLPVTAGRAAVTATASPPEAAPAACAENGATLDSLLSQPVARPTGGSATVSGPVTTASKPEPQEGEIYIRADGKKVRRVKKKKPAAETGSISTHLASDGANASSSGDNATVPGDMGKSHEEGEIYIRADGKKVRRVKKKKSVTDSASSSVAPAGNSLGAMLDSTTPKAATASDSATVPGNMGATKPVEESEIYIRADGKKVRRVKKQPSTEAANAEEGEIYIRADGKKVRRVKKKTPMSLDGMLADSVLQNKVGSGSATVTGAEGTPNNIQEGEIYIRADGKKVRRIRKTNSVSGKGLSTFLGSGEGAKAQGGSATVAGDGKELGEIYIRADGKKVRRVKKKPQAAPGNSESLAGFLDTQKTGTGGTGFSGSATVTGAEGRKAQYAEGEIYIRADGKRVRRIRKTSTAKIEEQKKTKEEEEAEDKNEPKPEVEPAEASADGEAKEGDQPTTSAAGDLAGFLDSAAESKPQISGSATVAGDMVAHMHAESNPDEQVEIITRPDGTKVKRIRRRVSASGSTGVAAGEEGEIITRPDGTRVRRIVRRSIVSTSQRNLAASGDNSETTEGNAAAEIAPEAAQEQAAASDQAAQEQAEPVDGEPPKADDLQISIEEKADGKDAFIVVNEANQEEKGNLEAAPDVDASNHAVEPDSEERFAVKMGEGTTEVTQEQVRAASDIRYLTLDELANLSGQNKEDLNAVVKQKMNLDNGTPRFVLSSPDVKPDETAASTPTTKVTASAPRAAAQPPPGAKLLPEGQVAVSEDVAKAAEAVSAMGATDLESLMAKLQSGDVAEILQKLKDAEKRQAKLEKQLQQAGVAIADDIPYEEAKEMVDKIAKRMGEIGSSDVTHPDKEVQTKLREEYFKLEQEMERYNTALMVSDEYQAEQDRIERKWEDDNRQANLDALKALRRHMPVNIRNLSEAALTSTPSPNGKYLPKPMAKKFKRTNVLMLIRLDPDDIERMHPSTLENMRVTGLTLTERRALYAHLEPVAPKWKRNKAEKMTEKKWVWYNMMKNNFKEALAPYLRHIEQYGPPDNHPYATREDPTSGCPMIGKQCPVKADQNPSYAGDYGWTEEAKYEASNVTKADVDDQGAKAMQEALELARAKKSNERATALKQHYKGVRFVSKANGSCEQMDEAMDNIELAMYKAIETMLTKDEFSDDDKKKEIANFTDTLNGLKLAVLDFAERAGMQTSGKKQAGGDGPDTRSAVECALSDEVYDAHKMYFKFLNDRMAEMKVKDTRVSKTIEFLDGMLVDLHSKNESTLKKLGGKRPDKSRKIKTIENIKEEVQKKLKPDVAEPDEEFGLDEKEIANVKAAPPRGGPGRGGLMDAIAGRARGGGGRGGLMDAIAGRGRGGPPGGDAGGRGGLMAAIAGRGRGGPPGGGRGGLMAAISARGGGGRGAGPPGGGRGGTCFHAVF